MTTVHFKTETPYDHASRILDLLRKMGFALLRMEIWAESAQFVIALSFEPQGALSPDTFLLRVLQNADIELSGTMPPSAARGAMPFEAAAGG